MSRTGSYENDSERIPIAIRQVTIISDILARHNIPFRKLHDRKKAIRECRLVLGRGPSMVILEFLAAPSGL